MNEKKNRLIRAMIAYDKGDPKRISHFLKVYEFARLIGEGEGLSPEEQEILETAAIVHDIVIKNAEAKFGSCAGKFQEQEGPKEAQKLLQSLDYEPELISRVSYLVGHHQTYTNVNGRDYRILLEADFLVNLYEDGETKKAVQRAYETIFETNTGKNICKMMFDI